MIITIIRICRSYNSFFLLNFYSKVKRNIDAYIILHLLKKKDKIYSLYVFFIFLNILLGKVPLTKDREMKAYQKSASHFLCLSLPNTAFNCDYILRTSYSLVSQPRALSRPAKIFK